MPYVRKDKKSKVVLAYDYEVPALRDAGWEVLEAGDSSVRELTDSFKSNPAATSAVATEEARKEAGIYDIITTPRDVAANPTTAPVEGGKLPEGGEEAVQGRKNTGGDAEVQPASDVVTDGEGIDNSAAEAHNSTVENPNTNEKDTKKAKKAAKK